MTTHRPHSVRPLAIGRARCNRGAPRHRGHPVCRRLARAAAMLAALLALLVTVADAQAPVPIIDLHHNTANGAPAAPYAIGTPVTVRGVLTVGVGTFTTEYTDIWLQDATGGVMIYQYGTPPYEFEIGDSVTIQGEIDQYNGMTEVIMDGFTLHPGGGTVPEPLVLTCADVDDCFLPDYSEPNEGRLVRLNNVTWTGTWPAFSGPVTLQDASGSCVMYIDGTTGVQDITPPGGNFDLIGVIKQYDGSSPYTSDYEILPRRPEDIILAPGPQILAGPRETAIAHDQVTIHLETETPTTVSVAYGETTSYELGTATDGLSATVHDVVLTGLDAATIHHYRVTATNAEGSTTTPDRLFCSGSAPGGTGTIRALFNKSVDHSLASYSEALGGQDFKGWLIDRINATENTIDVAIYSFNLPSVADALIAAYDRGVQIRFIYDNRYPYQTQVTRIEDHGIWVIDDAFGSNSGDGIMHHKLWIFDAGSSDPADPWVFSGSWNLTTTGTNTDAQNVIMIQDQALAAVCTHEFNEMWGSEYWFPDAGESRFGPNKLDDTPKLFNVDGTEIELYFAPSDPWLAEMVNTVEAADYHSYFCILSFTRYDLSNAMEARHVDVPGFAVRGVFDVSEGGNPYSEYHSMIGGGDYPWDPPADVWLDDESGTLHHKYMILDADTGSDPCVVTGSANWSTSANESNDENVLIVHDAETANWYLQEFAERYHNAGGTAIFSSDVTSDPEAAPQPVRLGPSPATAQVRAQFALESAGRVTCDLYTVEGRHLERLADRVFPAGQHEIAMPAALDAELPAGVYFLRLETPQRASVHRIAFLR